MKKKISLEAAYIISNMRNVEIRYLIDGIHKYPNRKLDLSKLKELPHRNIDVNVNNNIMYPLSKERVLEALIPPKSSNIMYPHCKK